ncbi:MULTISPECIES: benzoate/H(+) symporter BenE family transporter [unclassified Mesorhizobium]|uniref:benzoate/H(+) symporter BenE family transporter n=1 Tax=unclassified Mesorhizobium TaxID=325217 RepID=UPI000BAFC751|nr:MULTISPECIES: benzoate/H(+) symporter BenE family transporter [unclassified Mesorhizobium]TGT60557.1 benzoate/H(+) symporter BenE family transporter [Mesorhizobium sp. M00.F.Ca.ET.170.01.1.1]AZO10341.1 benzoate transporter BenE [Mesorhizobium sp. M3A.F.Ca.ET.080.04.2.1]PBB87863.1 benzoate transporter [Mesorhizobium sp. WSM3876]RWB73663.1 MAG: benzoate transporter BenE [Mesorhizobium sp.]RWB91781.1 MAG: benzoate transporter BenE [Mesorhizobium sp.]
MRISIPISAFVAAIVGFGGTLAVVIAAAKAVGATQIETASGVTALCLAMAFECLWLSWRTRMPVISAWSTPGLALVAASSGFSMAEAVGAFVITGILLVATALLKPLARLIASIPASVASGMLAGILVSFAVNAIKAVPADPWLILPLIAAFFVIRLFNPALSVLVVLVGGGLAAFLTGRVGGLPAPELSTLTWIMPDFSTGAVIGLGLPLYLVTMASQNLSGLAVLRAAGYHPDSRLLIGVTGLFSLLSAPFGAGTTNLAAISAALCTGPDVHPDPGERWKTGPFYSLAYLIFAVFGASLVAVFAVLPHGLIVLVAGLALLAPLANALSIALKDEAERMPATVTFAVTVSGLTLFGVGAAFWGLVTGMAVLFLEKLKKR